MQTLHGKNVLIVGGTSGIGLAAARQAHALGASTFVIGRDAATATRIAAEHGFAGGRAADVTRAETIESALSDLPDVDHLVLLAGSFVTGSVLDADLAYLRRAFDERIWAAVHVLRALGPRLAPDASVTLVSGTLADRPMAQGTAVIAAASAAMEALARGLALELAPRRVNTLSPGTTDTPLLGRALGPGLEGFVAAISERLPLRRLATADEVAAAAIFLMTNRYMTGETLQVDGGARLV